MTVGLSSAHRGYQYQDLVTAYFLAQSIVYEFEEVTVDRKRYEGDRFDDLEVRVNSRVVRRQFKYGDSVDRTLELEDLTTDRKDLRIDKLVKCYKDAGVEKADEYRLCTTWSPSTNPAFIAFLEPVPTVPSFLGYSTSCYKLRGNLIWPESGFFEWQPRRQPIAISRNDFFEFAEHFLIELNYPPLSGDLTNPGTLERLLLNLLTSGIGVGQYPNRERNPVDVAATLVQMAFQARASGQTLIPSEVTLNLRLRTDYGRVSQQFPIDKTLLVERSVLLDELIYEVGSSKTVILTGSPGAGKSWILTRLTEELKDSGHLVAKHYCYLEPGDPEIQKRITTDVLFANLLYELVSAEPALKEKHQPVYSSGSRELENILREAVALSKTGLVVLVIDGLDHVSRILAEAPSLAPENTNIVQQLVALNLPDGVCLIIGSQPGSHLAAFDTIGRTVALPDWNLDETAILAQHLGTLEILKKARFENLENAFIELLYEKSEGNPLYATFLCRELLAKFDAQSVVEPLSFLRKAPVLAGNISRYYDYLLADVESNGVGFVADVLGLLDFGLTLQELKEIMPSLGHRIPLALSRLKPILKEVTTQGGIRIYHESFRRFIVERLKEQGVSITDVVTPVINWLDRRGFYKDSKAYRFLLPCLRRVNHKQKIIQLIEFDFVSRSIEAGHPRSALQANLMIAIEVAAEELDWISLVRLSELHRSIYTCYDEKFRDLDLLKLYGQTFAELFGVEALVERLLFDGRATMPSKPGLVLCSLCDDAGQVPPWSEYLELESKELDEDNNTDAEWIPIAIAQFHGLLRLNGAEAMCKRLLDWLLEVEEPSVKYLRGILQKLFQFGGVDLLSNSLSQRGITGEIASVIRIELAKFISKQGDSQRAVGIATHALHDALSVELALECLLVGVESSEVAKHFSNLAEIITRFEPTRHYFEAEPLHEWIAALRIAAVTTPDLLIDAKEQLEKGSWYQNWLYFTAVLAEAEVKAQHDLISAQTILIEAIEYLASDTHPFKGEPRACDLYRQESTIHQSVTRALDLLKTSAQWKEVLECFVKIANETTTYLQRTPNGPLVHYALINLLLSYASEPSLYDSTFEIISQLVVRVEQSGQLYGLHAEYEIYTILALIKGGNIDLAHTRWQAVSQYLCAYGSRKDITIYELLDSLSSLKRADVQNARAAVKKVQPLVDAVVFHTDGKETRHAHNSWYKALCESDIVSGLFLLAQSLVLHGGEIDWRLESAVDESLSAARFIGNPLILSFLFATYPFDGQENSAKKRLDVVKSLIETDFTVGEHHFHLLAAQVQGDSEKFSVAAWECLRDFSDATGIELAPRQAVVGSVEEEHQTQEVYRLSQPQHSNLFPIFIPNATPLEMMKGVNDFSHQFSFSSANNSSFINAFGYRLIELLETDAEHEAIQLINYFANEYYFTGDAGLLAEIGQGLERYGYPRVAAISFTLAYCCSRGGGGWLRLGGFKYEAWLIHALELSREAALQCLAGRVAHFLYEPTYVIGITRHLIEFCVALGEPELAFRVWNEAFQVIQHRLPSHETTTGLFLPYIPEENSTYSVDEGLILLLLARATHPELERKITALSGLATLCELIPDSITVPFQKFLYRDTPITSILSVLQVLFQSEPAPYSLSIVLQDEFQQLTRCEIFGIRVLAKILLQRIGVEGDATYRRSEFTATPVTSNKQEAVISLDWGDRVEQLTEIWTEFPILIAARFDQIWQSSELYREIAESRYRASNSLSQRNIPHTQILMWEQELFEVTFHEVLNNIDIQLWNEGEWSSQTIQEIAKQTIPCIKPQVSRWNSRVIRPSLLLPSVQKSLLSSVDSISDEDSHNGWYRCGYYERQLVFGNEAFPNLNCKIEVYAGIVFENKKSLLRTEQIPFGRGSSELMWFWQEGKVPVYLSSFRGPLVGLAWTRDYLGSRPVLGLPPKLSVRCGLSPIKYPGRLELLDSQGKSTVLFRWWSVRPLGDELSEQAPILQGCDLILRADIFKYICQLSTFSPVEIRTVRQEKL